VHFSLRVPEWTCDHFRLTSSEGEGHGESLRQFPVRANECLIADRGYAHAAGIWHVHQKGGFVIVRHNAQTLPVEDEDGKGVDLRPWWRTLTRPGQAEELTRVAKNYPELTDDEFVAANREAWLK
jgi:hypothetical protein